MINTFRYGNNKPYFNNKYDLYEYLKSGTKKISDADIIELVHQLWTDNQDTHFHFMLEKIINLYR